MDSDKIRRMRDASYLLPDPGGEVVRECLTEIERLRSRLLHIMDSAREDKGRPEREHMEYIEETARRALTVFAP